MTDKVNENSIPSPCISVCKINAQTEMCEGCWRTLDEIASWGMASETVKQEIWQKIHLRIQKQHQFDLSAFDPE
jgi:predicted Fe-S protein YdhL (DUF1289 family)